MSECDRSPTGLHERRDMAGDFNCKHCGAAAFAPRAKPAAANLTERALFAGWILGLAEKLGDGERPTPEDITMLYRASRLFAQDANAEAAFDRIGGERGK